eukprot:scaffold9256_cov113-Isochrysis_galbana.AAC.7
MAMNEKTAIKKTKNENETAQLTIVFSVAQESREHWGTPHTAYELASIRAEEYHKQSAYYFSAANDLGSDKQQAASSNKQLKLPLQLRVERRRVARRSSWQVPCRAPCATPTCSVFSKRRNRLGLLDIDTPRACA